jgi:hypothetical protein
MSEDNSQVQLNRDKEFRDKFVRFNEQENAKRNNYFKALVTMDKSPVKEEFRIMQSTNGGVLNNIYTSEQAV